MQVYALDSDGKMVFVGQALSGEDYFCIECQARVRLRKSQERKNHFFHLALQRECRLAGKSRAHIEVQNFLQRSIGHQAEQEVHFSEIARIADIAWFSKKIVIEVQCSPISAKEVEERTRDYESIGWQVVWILHDTTFPVLSRWSGLEPFFKSRTHYYTNIQEGRGIIYDRCAYMQLPVDIATLEEREVSVEKAITDLPSLIRERLKQWRYSAIGDSLWHVQQEISSPSWTKLLAFLARQDQLQKRPLRITKVLFQQGERFVNAVRSLWYLLLENSCR